MSADERAAAQNEFAQAAQEFVSYLEGVRNLSPNTVRAYRIDLEAYVSWLAREGVVGQKASHRDLRRYLADLTRAGYSTRTVNRHLSAVRGLYRWLVREGRVTADAAAALASPKIAKTLPRTMSDSDVDLLVAGCDLSDAEGLRDCAFLELLYATGARISEVARLKLGDIDFAQRQVLLFGKGSKERVVPVYERALNAVTRYMRDGRPELLTRKKEPLQTTSLFISARGNVMSADALRKRFERHARLAGLDAGITPHAMRHTYATELLSGGADLRSVQELLGHESLATTQIYTHLSVERLKEATRQAHPRGQ